MSNIKNKVAKGAMWIFVSRMLVNVLSFASTIILARLLTPEDFGLVATGLAVLAIITAVTDLPISSVLVQKETIDEVHYDNCFSIGLLRGFAIIVIFLIISYPISIIFKDNRLFLLMIIIGFTAFIPNLNNPKIAILTRNLEFWQTLVLDVSSKLSGLIVASAIAYFYKTYWALVAGSLTSQIVGLIISYFLIPYVPKINFSKFKEFFHYSIWLSMGQALQQLNLKLDQFIISYFFGKAQLGVYNFADNLSNLPTREATTPIANTLFPAFSRLRNDFQKLQYSFLLSQKVILGLTLPMGFGFSAIAPMLVTLAVGDKWHDAIPIIQLCSMVFAYMAIRIPTQSLAMALGETKSLFMRDVIYLGIRAPFIVGGMYFGGFMGIVYGRCIASVLGSFVVMAIANKTIKVTFMQQLSGVLRYIIPATLMFFAVLYFGNYIEPIIHNHFIIIALQLLIGGLIYTVTTLAIWLILKKPFGLESEVFKVLKSKLSKN